MLQRTDGPSALLDQAHSSQVNRTSEGSGIYTRNVGGTLHSWAHRQLCPSQIAPTEPREALLLPHLATVSTDYYVNPIGQL